MSKNGKKGVLGITGQMIAARICTVIPGTPQERQISEHKERQPLHGSALATQFALRCELLNAHDKERQKSKRRLKRKRKLP